VAFHAHPDDEALLSGGTLARCASEGHRVVLVVATAGERGLAVDSAHLAHRRLAELHVAAARLGVARTIVLGYQDSGFEEPVIPPTGAFCAVPQIEPARRLADVLAEERADVLTVYDAQGGYGHRDHLRVREVGLLAASLAGTPVVLAATVDRDALLRGLRLLRLVGVRPGGMTPDRLGGSFSGREEITHVVDVRRWVRGKQAALAAHASQAAGGADPRPVRLLSRLPWPLSRWVLGREFFIEEGRSAARPAAGDIFDSLRSR
jgi:LmbE family N-acetylglucosaminyl deacetylase